MEYPTISGVNRPARGKLTPGEGERTRMPGYQGGVDPGLMGAAGAEGDHKGPGFAGAFVQS